MLNRNHIVRGFLILILAVVLSGCSAEGSKRYKLIDFGLVGNEQIIAEGDYLYINVLLGNPTNADMLEMAGKALDRLNNIALLGDQSESWPDVTQDYINILDVMGRLRDLMLENAVGYRPGVAWDAFYGKAEQAGDYENLTEDQIKIAFGHILTAPIDEFEDQIIFDEDGNYKADPGFSVGDRATRAAAIDLAAVVANVQSASAYEMLEYLMTADVALLYDAFSSIKINGFEDLEQAERVQAVVIGLITALHDVLPMLYNEVLPILNNEKPGLLAEVLKALDVVTVEDLCSVMRVLFKLMGDLEIVGEDGEWVESAKKIMEKLNEFTSELFIGLDLKGLVVLVQYLFNVNEDGSDNVFVHNLKTFLCQVTDVQHDTYNPRGKIPQTMGAITFLDHLIKRDGLSKYNYSGNLYPENASIGRLLPPSYNYYDYENLSEARPRGRRQSTWQPYGDDVKDAAARAESAKGVKAKFWPVNPVAEQGGAVLVADPGMFDLYALLMSLYGATDEQGAHAIWEGLAWIVDRECVVWEILGIDTSLKWPVAVSDIIGLDANESLITLAYVQAMFRETGLPGESGSLVESAMTGWMLDEKGFGEVDTMYGLLVDLGELAGSRGEFTPDSGAYHFALDMLRMITLRARP